MKLLGWSIRILVVIFAIHILIQILNLIGISDFVKESFERYEKDGGSVFIEGPDALDPLDNNEPIFGTENTTGTKSEVQVPEASFGN